MHDVARLAGVSHQTVSRVLNELPGVRETTRARVDAAIRELGYRPNVAARALVTDVSRAIGVVAADTTLFGPASMLLAIEQSARRRGRDVTVASLTDLDAASVADAFDYLERLRVGGIIVMAPQRTAADAMLALPEDTPVVAVDGGLVADLPIVCVDQGRGAGLVTAHLLDLGHRTVHHVAGPSDWLEAEERVAGWRAALRAAGREVPDLLRGGWTAERGYAAGRRLARDPEVTAVFAANDQTALGVIRALQDGGRRVPEDVSVAGFDDVPEGPYYGPALTTVRQGFPQLGDLAVATLLELVAGGNVPRGRVPGRTVAPTLVVRRSTARPPHRMARPAC
jgi:DNA-binding LacI/PurR family transcriptional regulator